MNIKRLIQLPRTILNRHATNQKIKKVLALKTVKEIREEQKKIHTLFLNHERKENEEETMKLEAKLEVFDWLLKK